MRKLMVLLGLGWSLLTHAASLSFTDDVQPIITEKCVACHACYDAPCQLNLGSADGLGRGAHKLPVYQGTCRHSQQPTRLFIDADTEDEWRELGFFDILQDTEQQSVLLQMLSLARQHPFTDNQKLPASVDLRLNRHDSCPTPAEFATYARKHPHGGMPYGVTGLSEAEYGTLANWLVQGAAMDAEPWQPTAAEQVQIDAWETMMNGTSNEQRLLGRWLFEHLFLAHVYLDEEGGKQGRFFQWVRSSSASGEVPRSVAARRPNEEPGAEFQYRLRPVQDVLVHKTHITYALTPAKLERIQELFWSQPWQVETLPGYDNRARSNPFVTFAAIPAAARYQFMLDDAEYFVRTFIRGPVCRGQIATDVIRDNFWALFQDPAHDLYVNDAEYRERVDPLLALPGIKTADDKLLPAWRRYSKSRNRYEKIRSKAYAQQEPINWDQLWQGNDNALLSIFRHHDSAAVRKGLLGQVPKTMWLLDYPLLERTYYQLVVNFDVFDNLLHQLQTRLYFDLIRNGAEVNFLRLMPEDSRKHLLGSWYQRSGKVKQWLTYTKVDKRSPSGIELPEEGSVQEFGRQLSERFAALDARPDPINRCNSAHCHREGLDGEQAASEQMLSRLASRPAAGLAVINFLPEASMLRVDFSDGSREIYSLLRNRAHSNVAFMMAESLRYQPGLDTLTIYPEVLSSYPNFIFNVQADELAEFVEAMQQISKQHEFDALVGRWGIRRSHPQFWDYFHDLSRHIGETQPLEQGVLDLNRYENL